MLSASLHKHLDAMDEIEIEMQAEIDLVMSSIDKKQLINDPTGVMNETAEMIKKILEEKYIPMAAKLGFSLNDTLKSLEDKDKNIIIDPSKDGTKNEEFFNV